MVLVAEILEPGIPLKDLQEKLTRLGEAIGVEIKVQHEDIFNVMHRI